MFCDWASPAIASTTPLSFSRMAERPSSIRLAAEFWQIAVRFEHRLLGDVRRIEFALKLAVDLQPSQEPQPRLKRREHLGPRGFVAMPLGTEQLEQVHGQVGHDF